MADGAIHQESPTQQSALPTPGAVPSLCTPASGPSYVLPSICSRSAAPYRLFLASWPLTFLAPCQHESHTATREVFSVGWHVSK